LKYSELAKIEEVEARIKIAKSNLDNILPIWNSVDRKIHSLRLDIKMLEDEKTKLTQGQLLFDENF
jgi:hypothetical protein